MEKTGQIVLLFSFFFFGNQLGAQTLNLGILSSFEAYTGTGAVANEGSLFTGDAGSNNGIISGCVAPNFIGDIYNADAVTDQCKFDLFRLYIHLNDLFVNYPGTHAAAFGAGETITAGVYSTGGAGSVGGVLTLDGAGDPDAYFVIKCNGALTIGAGATINLVNGAQSCNVFWIAEGAISVGAGAIVKGTLFAHIGAVGLGANVDLEGRMFSFEGAITIGADATAIKPSCVSTIPIFCEAECDPASEVDVLGVLSNFALYTSFGAVANTSTSGIDGDIGTNGGDISGYGNSVVTGLFQSLNPLTVQAEIDINNAYTSLMALSNTVTNHAPAFGSGETLTSGVYSIGAAGSLAGTLTLDAQNNPDAIFVFKFAGALSIAAAAKVILANGARTCNVFWVGGAGVATGAVSMGAAAVLKGTFLSHGGACSSGAGVFLEGRQLSTAGAVNTYSGTIYNNPVCITSASLALADIVAIADTVGQINGTTGGSDLINVLDNDSCNGDFVNPVQVNLTTVTPNLYVTLNADGSIDVAANTPVGTHTLTYQICEVSNPSNCKSALVTVESVSCIQTAEPATFCGETATFNLTTCSWDIETQVSFIQNTSAGVSNEVSSSWGMAWGDYDNDGFDDLFVPVKTLNQANILYHNNTDGTFSKVTVGPVVTDLGASVSGTWGDYDNDGYLDLFVTNNENSSNKLYHNNGDGTFTSVLSSPIVEKGTYSHSAAWADYNKDGFLDIVVSDFHSTNFNFLFYGDGQGGFEVDEASEVSMSATSAVGVAWGDYDNDGDLDLFIANTNGENNQLFQNVNGVLIAQTSGPIVTDQGHSVGGTWGDYDNDGDLDLYVTNSRDIEANFFYQNNGNGSFAKLTNNEIVNYMSNSHGASWIDFDNDGDLDLLVANDQNQENWLFSNNGDGTFEKLVNAITQELHNSYGTAWSDYDNDGDYDLFVANKGANANDFFINENGSCTNYISVKLNGCNSNKFGVGAMVRVKATIDGQVKWQTKHVSTQTSAMGGQNSSKLLFGLLDATGVDSIVVVWPSGVVSYLDNSAINSLITVNEECGAKVCGVVYFDENQNQVQDISEPGISNQKIIVSPGNFQFYTNESGAYQFYMADGDYTLSYEPNGDWGQYSPNGDYTVNVQVINAVEYCGNDFGASNSCLNPDLEITVGTAAFRKGLTNEVQVLVKNVGAFPTTESLHFTIELTDNVYMVDDYWISQSELNGLRTYTYNLSSLDALSDTLLFLSDSVANNANLDDFVSLKAEIDYSGTECSLLNNLSEISDEVVGSIDPNDKLVFVEARGVQPNVALDEKLIYKIRFQNVGNYSARRVFIEDQLSPDLDWSSFEFLNSSHHFEYALENGRLTFVNENIELPDSASNPEGSNGYIQFKIGLKSEVEPFQHIVNVAEIQFDYNEFIITNRASIIAVPFGYNQELSSFVYPNPTSDVITVMLLDEKQEKLLINKVILIDARGLILDEMILYKESAVIDLTNYEEGMYFVHIFDEHNHKLTAKVIRKE